VDLVGVQRSRLDQLLDLGDRDPTTHRRQRAEVACGPSIDEVAVAVALPGADQAEVTDDRPLQDVVAAVERPGLLLGRGHDDIGVRVVLPRRPTVGHLDTHPVAVKKAGIPDPPDRSRSASVPYGVSSTSSSPRGTDGRTPCSPRRTTRPCGATDPWTTADRDQRAGGDVRHRLAGRGPDLVEPGARTHAPRTTSRTATSDTPVTNRVEAAVTTTTGPLRRSSEPRWTLAPIPNSAPPRAATCSWPIPPSRP